MKSFPAQQTYRQRVLDSTKIMPRYRTVVDEVLGEDVVIGVRARELASGKSADVELTGLFVYVGLQPNTAILRNLVDLSDSGRVPTDSWMKTARDGLYAVGDIRQDSAAQPSPRPATAPPPPSPRIATSRRHSPDRTIW